MERYSFGMGDRFMHEGVAQLEAIVAARKHGVRITPVWNKSFREHETVSSAPESVRKEADQAVKELGWEHTYLVDADHITFDTVDDFIPYSDFYTIDVADEIGKELNDEEKSVFISHYGGLSGSISIEGIEQTYEVTDSELIEIGNQFYRAILEAKRIFQKIYDQKKDSSFSVEISMDEVEHSQTPLELYFILKMVSDQGIPLNTIAPKFTGMFKKGVDYEGDLGLFAKEFERDLLVIRHCVKHFELPEDLKLSVHTGSDKFSIYPVINELIKKHDSGLHLKTAGTTWLEELIGLSESEGEGLELAKSIYREAYNRYDELTKPYAAVLSIDPKQLPKPEEVNSWSGNQLAAAIRHKQSHSAFNPHMRQLLHTGYKVAAEMGEQFTNQLKNNRSVIARHVTDNLLERHIKPLFF